MRMPLRRRIFLTLLPLLALIAVLGGSGAVLLHRLGGRIDTILRENYDSVLYMEGLQEALERIDSSFQFTLARHGGKPVEDREKQARKQYDDNWAAFRQQLQREQNNITLPGEAELVERLTAVSEQYRRRGDDFFARPPDDERRADDYFGPKGLLETFQEAKTVSGQILSLNQENMVAASEDAKRVANESLAGFAVGLVAAVALACWLTWVTARSILTPISSLTQSALAIGRGDLDQVVAVRTSDELGSLAEAFNLMARQIRHYRQSDYSRLVRAQRTSQATIDSFPDPVLVLNPDGEVEMANPAARRLFGVQARGAAAGGGGSPTAAGPMPWEPPAPLRTPLQDALRDHRPYLSEHFDQAVTLTVDGKEKSFLPRILPIKDPYELSLGAGVLLIDVTRFRLLDQFKSDLVATVSHELKTPLTSVRLAVHLLLEEVVGPLTPKQTELLVDARDNAERLLTTVNHLLDLTRLEQGREYLDLRPESPRDLLTAAADAVRARAEDRGVAVEVEAAADLPPVAVDAERLGHALGNLLDNAVTHTDRGGRITLSARPSGEEVTLTVADTGVGIPEEYLPRIFERFFRIPGQSRGRSTGLGLAIVREIISAHGGTVTCESRPGEGTAFHLTLPVWRPTPAEVSHPETLAAPAGAS